MLLSKNKETVKRILNASQLESRLEELCSKESLKKPENKECSLNRNALYKVLVSINPRMSVFF